MKRVLLFLFVLLISMSLFAEGKEKSRHFFNLDEAALEVQFEELTILEHFVLENENVTAINLKEYGFDMAGYAFNTANMASNLDFQWEGFLWGFLCCPVGFFVVAINSDQTHDNKISFWIGVAASVVLNAIASPIYYRQYIFITGR